MRTTLAIDEDVLVAARAMARAQGRTLGEVISDLSRRALARPEATGQRNGLPVLGRAQDALPVTLDLVNTLRDEGA